MLLGIPTCTVTAVLLLGGRWSTEPWLGLGAVAVLAAATVTAAALTRAGLPGGRLVPGETGGAAAPTAGPREVTVPAG